ncbi:cell wall-binding repeat-containing protein [Peptostreptococcus russellii]|uniref:cell wall-binding repeat-containing protein n=1 Tax=Peptostreptococcus russellii TaxID=215200 RepID=UPI00162A371E|nr:cell wall-binding repeat-containing protein [Peptostreptococcus russellii]MBC2578019.1 cell wall-binding repeat-containing protein [Peptostreptococcus russellii]
MKIKKLCSFAIMAILLALTNSNSSALWKDYEPYGGFDGGWKRFYGVDRIKTAEYTANTLNPHKDLSYVHKLEEGEGVPVVLVNQNSFQDGLSAYNLCKKFDARLLLIKPNYANISLMRDYYKSKTIYLLGSENEIYKSTEDYIKKYMPETEVIRISGATVYDRNLKTLKLSGYKDIAVADGRNFPDALSASGICNNKNLGLMLVDGSKNYTFPTELNIVYTIGGPNSVLQDNGTRLSGADRYDTAKNVAREANGYKNILFVDGRKFPDSISAINLVKARNAIVMPISNNRNNSDMKEFLSKLPSSDNSGSKDIAKSGYALFIGGPNSISDKTIDTMLYPSRAYENK